MCEPSFIPNMGSLYIDLPSKVCRSVPFALAFSLMTHDTHASRRQLPGGLPMAPTAHLTLTATGQRSRPQYSTAHSHR